MISPLPTRKNLLLLLFCASCVVCLIDIGDALLSQHRFQLMPGFWRLSTSRIANEGTRSQFVLNSIWEKRMKISRITQYPQKEEIISSQLNYINQRRRDQDVNLNVENNQPALEFSMSGQLLDELKKMLLNKPKKRLVGMEKLLFSEDQLREQQEKLKLREQRREMARERKKAQRLTAKMRQVSRTIEDTWVMLQHKKKDDVKFKGSNYGNHQIPTNEVERENKGGEPYGGKIPKYLLSEVDGRYKGFDSYYIRIRDEYEKRFGVPGSSVLTGDGTTSRSYEAQLHKSIREGRSNISKPLLIDYNDVNFDIDDNYWYGQEDQEIKDRGSVEYKQNPSKSYVVSATPLGKSMESDSLIRDGIELFKGAQQSDRETAKTAPAITAAEGKKNLIQAAAKAMGSNRLRPITLVPQIIPSLNSMDDMGPRQLSRKQRQKHLKALKKEIEREALRLQRKGAQDFVPFDFSNFQDANEMIVTKWENDKKANAHIFRHAVDKTSNDGESNEEIDYYFDDNDEVNYDDHNCTGINEEDADDELHKLVQSSLTISPPIHEFDRLTKAQRKATETFLPPTVVLPFSKQIFTAANFSSIGVNNNRVIQNLEQRLGIGIPTRIQAIAIPAMLGRQLHKEETTSMVHTDAHVKTRTRNVVVHAQTGSGKTLAYLLPLLDPALIDISSNRLQAIILAPSRELVQQIAKVATIVFADTGLRCGSIIGGANARNQIEMLRSLKPQILVATPGRLAEIVFKYQKLRLSQVRVLVVDEVDHLLKETFVDELRTIIEATPLYTRRGKSVPQTILSMATTSHNSGTDTNGDWIEEGLTNVNNCSSAEPYASSTSLISEHSKSDMNSFSTEVGSATMICLASATAKDNPIVEKFANEYCFSPQGESGKGSGWRMVSVDNANILPATITHGIISCSRMKSFELLRRILHAKPEVQRALIFVNDPHRVEFVCQKLKEDTGIIAAPLHGDASKEDRKVQACRIIAKIIL